MPFDVGAFQRITIQTERGLRNDLDVSVELSFIILVSKMRGLAAGAIAGQTYIVTSTGSEVQVIRGELEKR